MPAIQAVLFDIDDTLFSTTQFSRRARMNAVEALREYGVRMDADALLKELLEVVAEFSSNYEHHFEKLLLRIPAETWAGSNRGILIAAAVAAYHRTKELHLVPYPDAIPLLRDLAAAGVRRGVVSDGLEVKQAEKIVRLGIYPLLTPGAVFISDQIGISKPNPKLFQRACDAIGVPPASAVYIGDHPVNDVGPAKRIGMKVIRVRRDGKHAAEPSEVAPDAEVGTLDEAREALLAWGVAPAAEARRA